MLLHLMGEMWLGRRVKLVMVAMDGSHGAYAAPQPGVFMARLTLYTLCAKVLDSDTPHGVSRVTIEQICI